ncbi:MAG: hypothetical protein H7Y12_13635, partial [Sphingobacteriaceae bacterium]|nr:hypothetical protein [Cytophagaceae bacterium]
FPLSPFLTNSRSALKSMLALLLRVAVFSARPNKPSFMALLVTGFTKDKEAAAGFAK